MGTLAAFSLRKIIHKKYYVCHKNLDTNHKKYYTVHIYAKSCIYCEERDAIMKEQVMKKKRIVKSCSFDDTPSIQRFVSSQKNFSRSIRLLILDYIKRNDGQVDDVYENFERGFTSSSTGTVNNESM